MSKNSLKLFLLSLILLIPVNPANAFDALTDPSLVAWWGFDEGTGTLAVDGSGNGNDGTINGAAAWVPGVHGQALSFHGGDAFVSTEFSLLNGLDAFTLAGWVSADNTSSYASLFGQNDLIEFGFTSENGGGVGTWMAGNNWVYLGADYPFSYPSWHHLAITGDATRVVIYIDGQEQASDEAGMTSGTSGFLFSIGANVFNTTGDPVQGEIDDVWVYSRALSQQEIKSLMQGAVGPELASAPDPANEAIDVSRDPVLSWKPGEFADTHHVYLGSSAEDVNSATVPTGSGLDANSFAPGRLEFGKTYYWRVDEVNGTPDRTVFKGHIWSFTAEPYSVMVPVDINKATASSVAKQNTPDMTINGSGLNGMAHSTAPDAMWISASPDPNPWLMYEFDQIEKIDQMWVWNSNHTSESFIGWGVKDVNIEYSKDGIDWAALGLPTQFDRGPGLAGYDTPQVIDFGLVQAKFVRLDIQSSWGGLLPQYGLAEVQFYAVPVRARTPHPASGSGDVLPSSAVSWRAGREASQHTIYMSTDANAVTEGVAQSASFAANRVTLSSFGLQMNQTYYWRVDEVNEAEDPAIWAGPVWSLSTSASVIIDDFESYNNFSPDRPFQTWLDGFGYSADEFFSVAYPGNGTGAGIGHDIWGPGSPYFEGNLMERASTLPGSGQSLPFYYINTGGVSSETERVFTVPQDWTLGGAQTLSIAFRGQAGNTGTFYVKINNTKIPYPHDPANMAHGVWQAWNIDLSSVNTNLESITRFAMGVDGSGAAGMLLIDDITLHAEAGEVLTPVDPAGNGLVALYTFEDNFNDSSGHGHNCTVVGTGGTAIVQDATRGQVLSLPGGDDQYVEIGAVGISGTMPRTIACWAKAANTNIPDWTLIFGFTGKTVEDGSGGSGSHFNLGSLGGPGGIGAHTWDWEETMVSDQEGLNWHHYAMTYDGTTVAYFLDGMAMDSDPGKSNVQDLSASGDRVHIGSRVTQTSSFPGNVDDAVIYSRALSAEEILWLSGARAPIDKPF
ncbi:MAG: discoidin domain-containing protein [Phycisphaerae bacterium]|nr:discoidin domain-containing protein [Phycisphaerae bacterium]